MNKLLETNAQWVNETWEKIHKKMLPVSIRSREKIPYTTVDGVHNDLSQLKPANWTNGFWGGMMWLLYLGTGNEEFKKTAIRAEELLDKALENYDKLHHDVGFMWIPTSVANYRITGNAAARNKALFIASTLFSRYNIDGRYIRAWNDWAGSPYDLNKERTIIDCMMNIPLLYWASREIKDERFARVAKANADTVMRDHIREDGSVNHIVRHDLVTGEMTETYAGQGIAIGSSWSRGVAWAVYGFVLSYIHTGEQRYLDTAIKTADHFLREVKKTGYLPVSDFYAPADPVYYDSTAGMITACGLIEISKALGGEQGEYYLGEAINLLKACEKAFADYSDEQDALVLKGTGCYPREERFFKDVEIPIIYGDFYFIEAILKLKGSDFLIW